MDTPPVSHKCTHIIDACTDAFPQIAFQDRSKLFARGFSVTCYINTERRIGDDHGPTRPLSTGTRKRVGGSSADRPSKHMKFGCLEPEVLARLSNWEASEMLYQSSTEITRRLPVLNRLSMNGGKFPSNIPYLRGLMAPRGRLSEQQPCHWSLQRESYSSMSIPDVAEGNMLVRIHNRVQYEVLFLAKLSARDSRGLETCLHIVTSGATNSPENEKLEFELTKTSQKSPICCDEQDLGLRPGAVEVKIQEITDALGHRDQALNRAFGGCLRGQAVKDVLCKSGINQIQLAQHSSDAAHHIDSAHLVQLRHPVIRCTSADFIYSDVPQPALVLATPEFAYTACSQKNDAGAQRPRRHASRPDSTAPARTRGSAGRADRAGASARRGGAPRFKLARSGGSARLLLHRWIARAPPQSAPSPPSRSISAGALALITRRYAPTRMRSGTPARGSALRAGSTARARGARTSHALSRDTWRYTPEGALVDGRALRDLGQSGCGMSLRAAAAARRVEGRGRGAMGGGRRAQAGRRSGACGGHERRA
ncbi:hypothetical protein B0H15DRAFT_933559, partial [Mycena belliarum]